MIWSRRAVMMGGMALAASRHDPSASIASSRLRPDQWLDSWLAAFNHPDPAVYPAYVARHLPALLPYLDEDLAVREASGGFVLLRTEPGWPREVTGWLRDRNWDRFSKVTLSIGASGPEDLSFAGAPDPATFAVDRMGEDAALAALVRKLDGEAAAGRLSGVVRIARGGQVLLDRAWGACDAAGTHPVTPQTRFCIGSAGKMFTAVAALHLVQLGRLRLGDRLADWLPDLPDGALARTVTVRHLLTHTGGTGDFFGADYEAHAAELRTPTDFVRRFGRREPLFPPGSRWGYSNFGFILLGAIIERASGQAWDALLADSVFRVAGMTATSATASPGDSATPLIGAARTGLKPLPFYVGTPAGGGYSTVGDLHHFAQALRSGLLLDAQHLRLMTEPAAIAGSVHWSLGLRIATRNGATSMGHRGSAPGANADIGVYPRSGYGVFVLTNRGHPHASNVAEFIGARLPIA